MSRPRIASNLVMPGRSAGHWLRRIMVVASLAVPLAAFGAGTASHAWAITSHTVTVSPIAASGRDVAGQAEGLWIQAQPGE